LNDFFSFDICYIRETRGLVKIRTRCSVIAERRRCRVRYSFRQK